MLHASLQHPLRDAHTCAYSHFTPNPPTNVCTYRLTHNQLHPPQTQEWAKAIEPILAYMRRCNVPYSLRTFITLIVPSPLTDTLLAALEKTNERDFWSS